MGAGGLVHALAVQQLAVGVGLQQLVQWLAFEVDHCGGFGVARQQVGAVHLQDGFKVEVFDYFGGR